MKILHTVTVLVLSLFLLSCGGEAKKDVIPEPTEESLTATINGNAWKANVADLFLFDEELVINAQELDANNIPIRVISIQGKFARAGTYGIGSVNGNEVGYFENNEQGDISRGALVITRITERWVEGTFNFEGSIGRGAANRRITVTNGRFALQKK